MTLKYLLVILTAAAGISYLVYALRKSKTPVFNKNNHRQRDFFQKSLAVKNKYVAFIVQLSINLTTDRLNNKDNNETIVGKVYLFDEAAESIGSEYQSQNLWDKPLWIPFIMESFNESRGCEGLAYSKTKKFPTFTAFCIDYEEYYNKKHHNEKILGFPNAKLKKYIKDELKTVLCVPIFLYRPEPTEKGKIALIPEKCVGILTYVSNKNFKESGLPANHHMARVHAKFFSYIFSKYNWSEEERTTDLAGIKPAQIQKQSRPSQLPVKDYVETEPDIYFMPVVKNESGLSEFINVHINEKILREEMEEFVEIEFCL